MANDGKPTLIVPKGAAQAMHDLTGEPRPEVALLLVLREAYAHRLEQIEAELPPSRPGMACHLRRTVRSGSLRIVTRTMPGRLSGTT
jgi:hypothetical protein